MKTYRQNGGPFKERPYYELQDIENICTQELSSVGLLPRDPAPIRIERFIEKRFAVSPVYEDLPTASSGIADLAAEGLKLSLSLGPSPKSSPFAPSGGLRLPSRMKVGMRSCMAIFSLLARHSGVSLGVR